MKKSKLLIKTFTKYYNIVLLIHFNYGIQILEKAF